MKKAFTFVMTLLLGATLVFAQDTGGDKNKKVQKTGTAPKANKNNKKGKKSSGGTTTPPPK